MEKQNKEKKPQPDFSVSGQDQSSGGKMSFEIDLPKDDYVTCIVCGHKNSKQNGICEMCSNYLFK